MLLSALPSAFTYAAPRTLSEALALMAQGDRAEALAGGQTLMAQISRGERRPRQLVDLGRIAALNVMAETTDGLTIGAGVSLRAFERSAFAAECPLLAEAISHIGNATVRNRATFGGTLAWADPCGEAQVALAVLGARADIAGPQGERTVANVDLPAGAFLNQLGRGELVVRVRLSRQQPREHWAFLEHCDRPSGGRAVASVALRRTAEGLTVAVGGVCPTPILMQVASNDEATQALARVLATAPPYSDLHGSAEHRRRVAGVLLRRALERLGAGS